MSSYAVEAVDLLSVIPLWAVTKSSIAFFMSKKATLHGDGTIKSALMKP